MKHGIVAAKGRRFSAWERNKPRRKQPLSLSRLGRIPAAQAAPDGDKPYGRLFTKILRRSQRSTR